jgi:hypothetical protein
MAKDTYVLDVKLTLNPEKAGGWLVDMELVNQTADVGIYGDLSAWKNASAAKRWIKAKVVENTPRKSVKLTATATDENGKPTAFAGTLSFKEPAA